MIFFLYGEDSFRSYERVLEIKKKFLESDKSGSGLSSFNAGEENYLFDKIKNTFGISSLFSSKRLVIIKRLISSGLSADQEKILEFLKSNQEVILKDNDWIGIFWEDSMPKKNGALFKFLEKNSKKQNFENLSGQKINQWVLEKLKSFDEKATISKSALEKLIAYSGGETIILEQEVQKLFNHSFPEMISEADVESLVKAKIESNIFETVDALGSGNKKKALEFLHKHLEKGDDPFYLFSMFIYQFRNILKVSDLKEGGMFNEYDIARVAKLHPFVVKKSLTQANNFGLPKLRSIYKKLGEMDAKIKTGKLDIRLALDKFVAEL